MDEKIKPKIKSESHFLLTLLWHVILTPWVVILALFGKRRIGDVFRPITGVFQFLYEARFTFWLILITSIISIAAFFALDETQFNVLLNHPSDITHISRYFSFITSGFLHGGVSHLFWNMLALFIFGRIVERSIGPLKMGLVYFSALILSGIIDCAIGWFVFGSTVPSLGASGALMGVVAAAVLLDPLYITYELFFPLPIMAVGWMFMYSDIFGILNPTEDGIGHLAHILGFLSITLSMKFLNIGEKEKIRKGFIINIVSIVVALVLYVYFWPMDFLTTAS